MERTRLTPSEIHRIESVVDRRARHAAAAAVKHYRNRALAGFLVLVGLAAYNFHDSGQTDKTIHHESIRARGVICRLIADGDRSLYQYQKDGTITKAQLDRALKQSSDSRKKLMPAENCPQGITPPGKATRPRPARRAT